MNYRPLIPHWHFIEFYANFVLDHWKPLIKQFLWRQSNGFHWFLIDSPVLCQWILSLIYHWCTIDLPVPNLNNSCSWNGVSMEMGSYQWYGVFLSYQWTFNGKSLKCITEDSMVFQGIGLSYGYWHGTVNGYVTGLPGPVFMTSSLPNVRADILWLS